MKSNKICSQLGQTLLVKKRQKCNEMKHVEIYDM